MQRVGVLADHDGVAGVGTTVVANHHVVLGGQQIDHLALAFIAPLKSNYCRMHPWFSPVLDFHGAIGPFDTTLKVHASRLYRALGRWEQVLI